MEGSDWLTMVKLISYWCRRWHLPGHSAEQVESNLRRVSHPYEYSVPGELGEKNDQTDNGVAVAFSGLQEGFLY